MAIVESPVLSNEGTGSTSSKANMKAIIRWDQTENTILIYNFKGCRGDGYTTSDTSRNAYGRVRLYEYPSHQLLLDQSNKGKDIEFKANWNWSNPSTGDNNFPDPNMPYTNTGASKQLYIRLTFSNSNTNINGAQFTSNIFTLPGKFWNDINAYNPAGVQDLKSLKFNLRTSDGGTWNDLTNEPSDFTKLSGTVATISDIRAIAEGIHYTGNNIGSDNAWSFTTPNWAAELYSGYNTKALAYFANGGTLASGSEYYLRSDGCIYKTSTSSWHFHTATYGTNVNLYNTSTLKLVRTGYHFLGWDNNGVRYDQDGNYAPYSFVGYDGTTVKNTHGGGNANINAAWGVNKGTFTYHTGGGTVSAPGYTQIADGRIDKDGSYAFHSIYYNTSDDLYNATTFGLKRSGYVFKGWRCRENNQLYDETTQYPGSGYTTTTGGTLASQNNAIIDLWAEWEPISFIKKDGTWKNAETKMKKDGVWKNTEAIIL